jgi:hypothetical protein
MSMRLRTVMHRTGTAIVAGRRFSSAATVPLPKSPIPVSPVSLKNTILRTHNNRLAIR